MPQLHSTENDAPAPQGKPELPPCSDLAFKSTNHNQETCTLVTGFGGHGRQYLWKKGDGEFTEVSIASAFNLYVFAVEHAEDMETGPGLVPFLQEVSCRSCL